MAYFMEELESKIPGCFGSSDYKFGAHPNDIERARGVLKIALEHRISFTNYINLFRRYLESKGLPELHIKRQLNKLAKVDSYFFT